MAKEMMEGVKPTRMQLLEIRKRKLLATKGHDWQQRGMNSFLRRETH